MASASSPEVSAYIADFIEQRRLRGESFAKIATLLGVTKQHVIEVHRTGIGAGPKLEQAFALRFHRGSVDELRRAAKVFFESSVGGRAPPPSSRVEPHEEAARLSRAHGTNERAIQDALADPALRGLGMDVVDWIHEFEHRERLLTRREESHTRLKAINPDDPHGHDRVSELPQTPRSPVPPSPKSAKSTPKSSRTRRPTG